MVKVVNSEVTAPKEDACCSNASCCEAQVPIRRSNTKVGRNDPCPCGSNIKYKKCCGKNA